MKFSFYPKPQQRYCKYFTKARASAKCQVYARAWAMGHGWQLIMCRCVTFFSNLDDVISCHFKVQLCSSATGDSNFKLKRNQVSTSNQFSEKRTLMQLEHT